MSSSGSNAGANNSSNNISSSTAGGVISPTTGVSNISDIIINATVTVQPLTKDTGGHGVPVAAIVLLLCLLLVGVGVLCAIMYLKRTGKLYKIIPFKPLRNQRRNSNSSSHSPLDLNEREPANPDHSHMDDLPPNQESNLFTIDDFDMESVDIDRTSRGTNDEYFYDEVFGKSMFEDEATNASMRQLYLASEVEDDMFDVDTIMDSIASSSKASKNARTGSSASEPKKT